MPIKIDTFPLILILIAQAILFSGMCVNLAKHKGYSYGNFALLGFFFGVFGLIYMTALPLRRDTQHPEYTGETEDGTEDEEAANKEGDSGAREKADGGKEESVS